MNIKNFLEKKNLSINSFAKGNDISPTTLWRAVKSRPLRPKNAARIEQATGGAVTIMELLFPSKETVK